MASSFQQQSRTRKLVYAGLIVALLTLSMVYRKAIIEPEAFNLQLRAEAQGEVELTSSAVRLTLLGSRGLATSVLWQLAIEKQKRHQWNQLDLLVTSITKLQPNFVTPWLFQSWNLAYNVAVECDQPRDKYFYVSRGTQLLAEGERRHQGAVKSSTASDSDPPRFPGNPEMRFYIGLFYQMKIGNSDEKNAMRCLFDLSCIDPLEWEEDLFWKKDAEGKDIIDMARFEEFCFRHPRLVRRLREKLYCSEPKEVLEFLRNNQGIPSRFDEKNVADKKSKLAPRAKQFPILPPARVDLGLVDPTAERFDHPSAPDLDVFLTCHYWYKYAQEPLPPLPEEPYMGVREPNYNDVYYKTNFRRPKMMLEIFRSYPARSMEYYADNREKFEGWFDDDGWEIDVWFDEVPGKAAGVIVGREAKYHAGPAWLKAYEEYKEYGERTGQLFKPGQEKKLEELAKLYRQHYSVMDHQGSVPLSEEQRKEENGQMGPSYDAHEKLKWSRETRSITNIDAHFIVCDVERFADVIQVRQALFNAQRLKEKFNLEALPQYKKALADWVGILLQHAKYRGLDEIQVETYENQWRYLELHQREHEARMLKLIKGMSQFADFNPVFNSPQALVTDVVQAFITKDKEGKFQIEHKLNEVEGTSMFYLMKDFRRTFENKFLMREVRGPLEWLYVSKGEDASARAKLALAPHEAQKTSVPPKQLRPDPESLELSLIPYLAAEEVSLTDKDWAPLLRADSIQQARANLRLEKKAPPPPAPIQGPAG